MKKMTCREMGGVCDMEITGETADEIMEKGKEHVHSQDDEGHKAVVAKMEEMGEEGKEAWKADFRSKFDSMPDA